MACRHRMLLLRRGTDSPAGPGAAWTRHHASWLGSLTFLRAVTGCSRWPEHSAATKCCSPAATGWSAHHRRASHRRSVGRADRAAECGIDTLTAIGLPPRSATSRSRTPRRLATSSAWSPCEDSCGDRPRPRWNHQMQMRHPRRLDRSVLAHRRHPRLVSRSAPPPSQSATRRDRKPAWRARLRLHHRWTHLDAARSKKRTTVSSGPSPQTRVCGSHQPNLARARPAPCRCEVRVAAAHGARDPGIRGARSNRHQPARSARSMANSGPSATNSPS